MTNPAPPPPPTTPCLIVSDHRMQANIERMARGLRRHDVPLRPHLKTCKNIEIARRLLAGQPGHATVSTLAEADYFFAHGIEDLLYAVGIAPGKLDAVAERMAAGMSLTLVLDHVDTAQAVGAAAQRLGCRFRLLLEIDCDGQRAGFQPQAKGLLEAAAVLAENDCEVAGVMVHAGGSYHCRDTDCIRAMAERERLAAVTAAQRLRQAGHAASMVSVGSTPTATFAENLDGVTEVRAGVHVFHDLVMVGLGVCDEDDIALSVLTEVIGHRPDSGQAIIDAGWMALSRDRGTASQSRDTGYGLVRGQPGAADVIVQATNQEHGLIGHRDGRPLELERYPIGHRLHILPNHACATAGQHAGFWLQGEREETMRWLPRCSGW
jgi:D-serine deaminase-like pyridoxal phosphate-dependent protein